MRTTQQPFEEAVRRHGVTVLRVCRALLGAGADADDAWSETFLAALRAWPELTEGANVEAWLVRIAQRKAIDLIRARREVPVAEFPELHRAGSAAAGAAAGARGGVVSNGSTPADPADSDADVWRAVAALPERQRLAIAYHYLGGLPHTETARLIGGSPEAVRRAAADGIRRLRAQHRGGPR